MLDCLLQSVELETFRPLPLASYFTSPTGDQKKEPQVSERLANFFNITATRFKERDPTPICVQMQDTPIATPVGSERKHRPDACLVLANGTQNFDALDPDPGAPEWFNIAAVFEYK
ncbi:hypothetical protein FRB93_001689 [Tulasnella sp. JGI-2019a]|nr:hypothetical protein FRB93_001689 [Tulasnella sp. JGI-2019a]